MNALNDTSNILPCKWNPPNYVTVRTIPAQLTYYVTASTPGTRRGDEIQEINRKLSGKHIICDCPRCSTK